MITAGWYGAECYAILYPGPDSTKNESHCYQTFMITTEVICWYSPEIQSGNWNVPTWINKHFPGLTAREAVCRGGMNYWTTTKSLFAQHSGYAKVLVVIVE